MNSVSTQTTVFADDNRTKKLIFSCNGLLLRPHYIVFSPYQGQLQLLQVDERGRTINPGP